MQNKAIVVGQLGTVLGNRRMRRDGEKRREEVVMAERRTPVGGVQKQFAINLTSSFGEEYQIVLNVGQAQSGTDLLVEGAIIAVEGDMRMTMRWDGRYADSEDMTDRGREQRDMALFVSTIRQPREDEPAGVTAAWVSGTVLEPPRFQRHPNQPSIEMALTRIACDVPMSNGYRPGYPGLRRLGTIRTEVAVAVNISDPFAGYLLKPGNIVNIDGEIVRLMQSQYGAAVSDALAKLEEAFVAADEDERRELRRQALRLSEQARTLVFATYAEPANDGSAELLTVDQGRKLRDTYVRNLRRRRTADHEEVLATAPAIVLPTPATNEAAAPMASAPRTPSNGVKMVIDE